MRNTAIAALSMLCAICLADGRPFLPGAVGKSHVLFVNVAGALSDADFAEAAELAASRVQINIWTNSIGKSMLPELNADPAALRKRFGDKCAVAVFVERNADGYSFMSAPGNWSMVNLRGTEKGDPSPEVLRDRRAKMLIKGMAYAGGSGATLEPKCSLFYGSFTLEGMDKTGVQISPMAYFPLLETLRAIGGDEVLSPVTAATDEE
jgi:hypothetical protein